MIPCRRKSYLKHLLCYTIPYALCVSHNTIAATSFVFFTFILMLSRINSNSETVNHNKHAVFYDYVLNFTMYKYSFISSTHNIFRMPI